LGTIFPFSLFLFFICPQTKGAPANKKNRARSQGPNPRLYSLSGLVNADATGDYYFLFFMVLQQRARGNEINTARRKKKFRTCRFALF
jgi:hypothetical protein